MCFKSGFRAIALAGALMPSGLALAQAGGGYGGHGGGPPPSALPGIGVGAYAPGQGPTGAAGWNGGSWRGYTNAFGPFWGGGGYYGGGYYGGESGGHAAAGGAANNFTYNHFDNRRRDGGFYGGGGVFYGDDGYSRLAPLPADDDGGRHAKRLADEAAGVERPSPHVIYLPDHNRRAGARGKVRR